MSDFDYFRDERMRQELQTKGLVDFNKYVEAITDWRRLENNLPINKPYCKTCGMTGQVAPHLA